MFARFQVFICGAPGYDHFVNHSELKAGREGNESAETPPVDENKIIGRGIPTRLIVLGVFVALVAGFYFSGLNDYLHWDVLRAKRESWRQIVDQNQAAAAILFVVISVGLMSLSLPVGSILSITAGALFDLWLGIGLIIIASAFGSTFAFLASRYLFKDFVRRWFGRWLKLVDNGIEHDGASYLLMLRLSPMVPFSALNAVMGLTHMRTRTYVLVTLVGMLPSCIVYTMAGTTIREINSFEDILSAKVIVLLTVLAIMPIGFRLMFRRRAKEPLVEPEK